MSGELAAYPPLNKAPIVEAVVDLRVGQRSGFQLETFDPLREMLAGQYPNLEEQSRLEHSFRHELGRPPEFSTRDLGAYGRRYRSADGRNIAQFRRDGFTFSRLEPYTRWEEVFGEAWKLWKTYIELAKPVEVTRIAVRYINRMLLPLPLDDLAKYLKAPPVVPAGWPPSLSGYLSRYILRDPESGAVANVTLALEPQEGDLNRPLIFDIDVCEKVTLEPNDATIPTRFVRLRTMKNTIFFGGLTPEAVELFR